jgi:hypothetical protein
MSPLANLVQNLFREGQVFLRDPPSPVDHEAAQVIPLLAHAFEGYRLTVAGPLVEFDAQIALAAGALLHHACWFLLNHAQPETELEQRLTMPRRPNQAAEHLSADLVLRYLPQVYRRARARDPSDPLAALLCTILCGWPLSGVLSEVEEAPLTSLDLGGHPGLQLLYAERWCRNPKPAWMPRGPGRACVELVWSEMGKDIATLPPADGVIAGPVGGRED